MRGYVPLISNDFVSHMCGLVVYVKEGFPFTQYISRENSVDCYVCFDWL